MSEPADYQNEVKHVDGEDTGIVIAMYKKDDVDVIDVRIDDHIKYATPEKNWETIVAESDL